MAAGLKLAPLLTEIKVNIDGFKNEMEKAKTIGVTEAEKISKNLSSVTKVGDSMIGVGKKMTVGLTLPIVGVGTAITNMAMDYESSFAKVGTLLDESVVDFDAYKKDILDASGESKIAVGEFSESVYNSISAGVDQTKAIGFTTEAMKLAKGGFTDGAKAVDVLTTAINAYGLEATEVTNVSDMLITTQNLGKTTVDELASSMGKVIPTANAYNVNLANVSTALADLTKNGIATAEATTYYNGMLNELGKSGSVADNALRELSGKGFAQLMEEGAPLTDTLKMLKDTAEESGKTLGDMFGSSEAAKAALVIMKDDGVEYNEILKQMESSAGATQKAFEKIDSTPAEKLSGSMNKLKNAGIELGIALIPVVEKVADVIGDVADTFSGLSEEQQENILKWGGILAAAGPVLTILGGGIKTVTGIASAVGGLSAAAGAGGVGLAASFGSVTAAAAPLVAGVAAVGVVGYGVYKTLDKEVIPTVDLFKSKTVYAGDTVTDAMGNLATATESSFVRISGATAQGVQSYMDMDDEVSRILYGYQINQETITDEIVADITSKFSQMGDSIKQQEEENYRERLGGYQGFFIENSSLTEIEEANILAIIEKKHSERELTVDESMARITEIYTRSKDEHRALTEQEQQEVNAIQETMRDEAISAFSETEAEAAVIRERMKEYQGRLSVEMASELVTKAIETRDGEIQAATEKCDEVIKQASRMLQAGDITQEQYDRIVKDAQSARDGTIKAAEDGFAGIIAQIEANTDGIMEKINTQTGKIRSAWSDLMTTLRGWWAELTDRGDVDYSKFKPSNYATGTSGSSSAGWNQGSSYNHFNGLNYVPYDGYTARLHEGERVLTKEENKNFERSIGSIPQKQTLHAVINVAGTNLDEVMVPMLDNGVGSTGYKKGRVW